MVQVARVRCAAVAALLAAVSHSCSTTPAAPAAPLLEWGAGLRDDAANPGSAGQASGQGSGQASGQGSGGSQGGGQSSAPAGGQAGNAADLAKKLANPIASLISVPFQLNYDGDIGPTDSGERWLLNVQPVIPFDISTDWNLISRTIVPLSHVDELAPGLGSETGLGDALQSLFFSPKAPTSGGWIWGAGPVLLLPTATDDLLGADKFGLGPTGVALRQEGPWTYGGLANHIWSVAGDSDRPDVNATFLQPFATYTTPDAWSFIVNSESTYDWQAEDWSIPVNALVTKIVKLGANHASIGGGLRYWLESPDSGPEGLGFRVQFILLF